MKFLGAVAYSLIWHIAPSSVGLVALIGVTTLAGLSMSLWRSVGLSTKSWWSGGFLVAIFATFMLLVNQHFHSFLNLPFTLISQSHRLAASACSMIYRGHSGRLEQSHSLQPICMALPHATRRINLEALCQRPLLIGGCF